MSTQAVPARPSPRLSVIVPAYRAEATIGACVRALGAQTLGREEYELLVVDDGSPDRTAEVAEEAGARVVRQKNLGRGAARNRGAWEAKGEILVFIDADCEAEEGMLEALCQPFEDATVGATKGAYLTKQREAVARLVQIEYESRYEVTEAYQARFGGIDFVDTYAAAFRRRAFEEAGGFDGAFTRNQDQELSFRLAARDVRMRFCAEARVYHQHAASLWSYWKKKAEIAFWKVAVLRRHPKRAVRDSHTPQRLKLEIAVAGAFWASLAGGAGAASQEVWAALGAPAALLVLFGALVAPFLRRVARRDPRLLLHAGPFLLGRATALGLGLCWGLVRAPRVLARRFTEPE